MTNDHSMSDIIHSWKEHGQEKLRKNQRTMKEKVLTEFKKISKEDLFNRSIDDVFQLLFFDRKDKPLYAYSSYPKLEDPLSSYLSEHVKAFYNETSIINEDGFNFMTYVEYILNAYDESYLYWCSYPQMGHDIIEEADTYQLTIIRFHKPIYLQNFTFETSIHPFIRSLNHAWSAQFKENSYDNCFRNATSNMNDLVGSIWDSVNILSALKYEGSDNRGGLLFIESYTPHLTIKLESPIPLSQHRSIRKLLQMSRKGHYLLINNQNIAIGFGNVITVEPVFLVEFLDHLNWRLYYGQKEFLSCTNLLPLFPNTGSDIAKLKGQLALTFKDIAYDTYKVLSIIQVAKKQNKGTMIVISENAATESQRLQSSSIIIHPVQLTSQQISLVTSIDGAVIIDPNGTCHAIGSILDGYSTNNGDSSRGARYNSALRYMNSQEDTRCMIVVVSEDRYIDILTK